MKGLPLAYAKDLQEDKEPVFAPPTRSIWRWRRWPAWWPTLAVNADAMKRAAANGYPTATDLADWLVANWASRSARRTHRRQGRGARRGNWA